MLWERKKNLKCFWIGNVVIEVEYRCFSKWLCLVIPKMKIMALLTPRVSSPN